MENENEIQAERQPLVVQELNEAKCSNPECDGRHPLALGGNCHPGAPTFVYYEKESEALALVCAVCNELVVKVQVARAEVH